MPVVGTSRQVRMSLMWGREEMIIGAFHACRKPSDGRTGEVVGRCSRLRVTLTCEGNHSTVSLMQNKGIMCYHALCTPCDDLKEEWHVHTAPKSSVCCLYVCMCVCVSVCVCVCVCVCGMMGVRMCTTLLCMLAGSDMVVAVYDYLSGALLNLQQTCWVQV